MAADDINSDGLADVIVGAGPGGAPLVKAIDGAKLGHVQANDQIANSALLANFFATNRNFTGGVLVAAE